MKLTCMMTSACGEKRSLEGPRSVDALEFQRATVIVILAAGLIARDPAAVNAASVLIPVRGEARSRLLEDCMGWRFSPVPHLTAPAPDTSDWFDVAGDVSSTAPGLLDLYRAASGLPRPFTWSPGQVNDVLQAIHQVHPILLDFGAARAPQASAAIEAIQTFLSLAHSNDGHVLARA